MKPRLTFDERTAAFQQVLLELLPENRNGFSAVKATRLAAKYDGYTDFVHTYSSIGDVDPTDKARLLEAAARRAGSKNWSCPSLRRYWGRYSDHAGLKAACESGSLDACASLGWLERKAKNLKAAARWFFHVCKRAPERENRLFGYCETAADIRKERGDLQGAIEAYVLACKLDKNACISIASTEIDRGNTSRARELYEEVCGRGDEPINCGWLRGRLGPAAGPASTTTNAKRPR